MVPESVDRISWWRQIDFATVPDHDLNTEIECVSTWARVLAACPGPFPDLSAGRVRVSHIRFV